MSVLIWSRPGMVFQSSPLIAEGRYMLTSLLKFQVEVSILAPHR